MDDGRGRRRGCGRGRGCGHSDTTKGFMHFRQKMKCWKNILMSDPNLTAMLIKG